MYTPGKVLPAIEPWNDAYYYNCYYGALFPMILHFGKSITPILLNDAAVYKTSERNGFPHLSLDFKREAEIEELLAEMGIVTELKAPEPSRICEALKESIDLDRPVLLFIDCFYQTMRPDAVNRYHWAHILLTYGYNDENQGFHVLEHRYRDGFTYEKALFVYEDALKCYQGFLENIRDDDFTGYLEYHRDGEKSEIPYTTEEDTACILRFIQRQEASEEAFNEGIRCLQAFVEAVTRAKPEELFTLLDIDHTQDRLGRIKTVKFAEMFRVMKVFGKDNPVWPLFNQLYMKWSLVIGIFSKIARNAAVVEPYYNAMLAALEQLPPLELQCREAFLKYLQEWRSRHE